MIKKLLFFTLFALLSQIVKAQNEFITIWKPTLPNYIVNVTAPHPANDNQIWFPGIGNNYKIVWEEVGYPQHNGTMTNVTSTAQVFIDFGLPLNPNTPEATYRVKVSNANGEFKQIQFLGPNLMSGNTVLSWFTYGNTDKIIAVEQWGNIQWKSMQSAFLNCIKLQLTATDLPNLSQVQDTSHMFRAALELIGNPSIENWNTATVKNMSNMFLGARSFNQPIGKWDTTNVTDMSYMFAQALAFNQPIDSWKTSKVTNMSNMFANAMVFNQPLNSWDTSNVTDMSYMFHFIPNFNQPLNNWNTSKVTSMEHMLHVAASFNQSLETWNLQSLNNAMVMITMAGIDCENYSLALKGWGNNPNTASNINLGDLAPFQYSDGVTNQRNNLISKGWIFNGDSIGECKLLSTSETNLKDRPSIHPNPATDFIYLKNIQGVKSYIILDMSGRIIMKDALSKNEINIQALTSGNYILQIITKDKIESFKFIKK